MSSLAAFAGMTIAKHRAGYLRLFALEAPFRKKRLRVHEAAVSRANVLPHADVDEVYAALANLFHAIASTLQTRRFGPHIV
jgi:hypothetical protein